MRAYDRDLIRGGHYGQRPRVPHLKAEHMAAPTNAANVKKALANSEPSTHGTKRTSVLRAATSDSTAKMTDYEFACSEFVWCPTAHRHINSGAHLSEHRRGLI